MDSSIVNETITCGICLETFNGDSKCPRMLSCGHSFCQLCLENLIGQRPCCPICKTDFSFGMAEEIPINFALKSLINIRSEVISSTISSVNALAVEEAYIEIMKQVSRKVEAELRERKATFETLEDEKKCLIEEIKKKEQEFKDRENHIGPCDLESLISDGKKFGQKLQRLHGLFESSSIGGELSKSISELENLLESQKSEIPNDLPSFHQPETLKQLDNWCKTESVYVQEDRFDVIKYGKVTVKDGRVWVHNFQPEKPRARLIQLVNPFFGIEEEFEILIQTNGTSLRAKNFLLLCSGLKGPTYKELTMHYEDGFCRLFLGPEPIVEGICRNDARVTLMKAGVYEKREGGSDFIIQLSDDPSGSSHEIGSVVAGFEDLIGHKELLSISDCGLVI